MTNANWPGDGSWPYLRHFALGRSFSFASATLLLAFWFRLQKLSALPIYYDEAIHLNYAHDPWILHKFFGVFVHARWLNVMLLALFQPLGPEALWLGRALSVLASLITAACTYRLGSWLISRSVGRLALLLYVSVPFAFFYDRQALADPLMVALGSLGLLFVLRALRRLSLGDSILAGVCLALSALTKFTGVIYWPLMLVGAVLLPSANRQRALGLTIVQAFGSVLIFGIVFTLAQIENGPSVASVGANNWCHSPLCAGIFDPVQVATLISANSRQYLDTVPTFYTPAIYVLAVVGLALGLRQRQVKIVWLAMLGFALALPFILIADLFPPRYLLFTLSPIAVLAASLIDRLLGRIQQGTVARPSWLTPILSVGLLAATFVPALSFDLWQIASPLTMPMPIWEWRQYTAGWPNSISGQRLVNELTQLQPTAGRRLNIIAGAFALELKALWGPRLGTVLSDREIKEPILIPWLTSGDPLCLVELLPKAPLGDNPYGLIVQKIMVMDVPGSAEHADQFGGPATATLWCVIGTTPGLSRQIANTVFGDPANAAEFYGPVADQLLNFNGPVLLYPPNQIDVWPSPPDLAAVDLRPLGNSWPVKFETITGEIEAATQTASEVRVVMAFEDRGDPTHSVERWLNQNLYPIDIQYSGPVRVLRYLTPPTEPLPDSRVTEVAFPNLAQLTQTAILDSTMPSSRLIRVTLTWSPLNTPTVSYKSFAHVFNAQGQLVAQHDDYPQANFAPTTTWRVGQTVSDHFVIYLPPELPSGSYPIKTGLYDPANGQRLLTTNGLDSVGIGEVVIP